MEDNNAQNLPINCANGCGFYGNPINNNMCSKCFKETSQKTGALQVDNSVAAQVARLAEKATQPESSALQFPAAATTLTLPTPLAPSPSEDIATSTAVSGFSTPASTSSDAPDSPAPGERAVQANKGRCFMCRAKIPLAKQAINKCRCEFVFCDAHKASTKHDCDFDFAKMGKDLLTKANPKLNDKPRGGRSFTRIQE